MRTRASRILSLRTVLGYVFLQATIGLPKSRSNRAVTIYSSSRLASNEKAEQDFLWMNRRQHISVGPVAGALGAELGGVHLGQLNDATVAEVRATFRAVADNRAAERRLERVTINGDKPF